MFVQAPPQLGNQYDDDPLLKEYAARFLLPQSVAPIVEELRHLGGLAGGALYQAMLADRLNEPVLTPWDPWGNRIDHIELTPLWHRAKALTAEHGLVAAGYKTTYGDQARLHQFLLNYVVQGSLDVYSCPLAMTDGAARTLLEHGNQPLIERAVHRLTSNDPASAWTSGQWMTERTGGSDVSRTETVARPLGDHYTLHGVKWFTSATTSEMALTLARPDGNPAGGRGLALFYLETRDEAGRLNGITIHRLKDKLGTRKVPTAELTLDGTRAYAVKGTTDGVKNISAMLNITRTWNSVAAAWGARRAIALALDYARRRQAFGAPLAQKPLHVDTLAGLVSETEALFHLTFRVVQILGRVEHHTATESESRLLRVLTPITKLTTAKQAVHVASEVLESFGGAGYVEDTGLPALLRDAQVLPIWEGTTNVLSLDTLKALGKEAPALLTEELNQHLAQATASELKAPLETALRAMEHALLWLTTSDPVALEAGARRFALTVGRTLQLGYLVAHAQWCLDHGRGGRASAAARRFAQSGVDLLDLGGIAADAQVLVNQ